VLTLPLQARDSAARTGHTCSEQGVAYGCSTGERVACTAAHDKYRTGSACHRTPLHIRLCKGRRRAITHTRQCGPSCPDGPRGCDGAWHARASSARFKTLSPPYQVPQAPQWGLCGGARLERAVQPLEDRRGGQVQPRNQAPERLRAPQGHYEYHIQCAIICYTVW
jgi:hypothetical protein